MNQKKLKSTLLMILLCINSISFSQKNKNERERIDPEKMAELYVKKMTLELDLTEKQQKEIKPFLIEQAKKKALKREEIKSRKEKKEKPTADERFEMKNEMLDHQIEMKNKFKKTLTSEQFEKWEKSKKQGHHKRKRHAKNKKDRKED